MGPRAALCGDATLRLQPKRASLGDTLTLTVTLASAADAPQQLAIDYALHFVTARGAASPKVFKGWPMTLDAGEQRTLVKRHVLRPITTRTYYAGRHVVELRINGRAVAEAAFRLSL